MARPFPMREPEYMMRWAGIAARVLATLLIAATLCMCGSRGSEQSTIRFWNGFTGPDGRTMLRMVKAFHRETPDTYIIQQRMDWATYFNKLIVAGLGGRAPEIFAVHIDDIPRLLQAGFIRPLDDLLSGADGIDANDFYPTVWNAVAHDGKHYALPLDVHPMGMYYNKAMFREAGIVDERGETKPPRTQAEFLDAIQKITKDLNGDGEPDQWGFVITYMRYNFISFAAQWGGGIMAKDENTCILDAPENASALEFWLALLDQKLTPPPQDFGSWVGFLQGRVGMAFEGIYMLADVKRQKDLDWGAAPLPQIGPARPATWASSHVLCMRTDLDDETVRKAWHFMKYLSEHALDWAEGGQVPVRLSQLQSPRFQAMTAQSAFAKQLEYIEYAPRVPYVFEALSTTDIALEQAIRGLQTPAAALADGKAEIERVIARSQVMNAQARSRGNE